LVGRSRPIWSSGGVFADTALETVKLDGL